MHALTSSLAFTALLVGSSSASVFPFGHARFHGKRAPAIVAHDHVAANMKRNPEAVAWSYVATPTQGADGWGPHLEPYDLFHQRYMTIGCPAQHDTQFFEACCHPRQQSENDGDYPAGCNTVTYGVVAGPDPSVLAAQAAAASAAAASAATPAAVAAAVASKPSVSSSSTTTTKEEPKTTKEPETTSSKPPPPTTTTTKEKPTTTEDDKPTASAIKVKNDDDDGGNKDKGGKTFTGQGTFFFQTNAGACGKQFSDNTALVALDIGMYGNENAVSPFCGRTLSITNKANGKSVDAFVADCCPTCNGGSGSLDLSTKAFDAIADRDTGVIDVEWHFT